LRLELLHEARRKLEHAIAAIEDASIELNEYERTLVKHIIFNQRHYIENINRMIERTQK
jgi:hypothetical protein